MTSRPGQDSPMARDSDISFDTSLDFEDEINRKIRHEVHQYKKAVPAPGDIDDSIWTSNRKDMAPNVVSFQCH